MIFFFSYEINIEVIICGIIYFRDKLNLYVDYSLDRDSVNFKTTLSLLNSKKFSLKIS